MTELHFIDPDDPQWKSADGFRATRLAHRNTFIPGQLQYQAPGAMTKQSVLLDGADQRAGLGTRKTHA